MIDGLEKLHLRVRGLDCVRGDAVVFQGVDFDLAPGEVIELHGRNGVGKSSLLRQIAGLVTPAAGTIEWRADRSNAWETGSPVAAQRFVGHRNGLKPGLTAGENLAFWARLEGLPREGVATALEAVGLPAVADRPARTLSAGQQRRVALARLVLAPRPLWLLDEPTAALDRASEESVSRLIEAHCAAGGSALIATHKVLPLEARALKFE